jgi:hypothetical protein
MGILKEIKMNEKQHIPSWSSGLFVNKNQNIRKR